MQNSTSAVGVVVVLVLLLHAPLAAQIDTRDRRLPLAPNRPAGEAVAPFLDGWYANEDGSYTFSLGYYNLNTRETIEVPVGPDNRIEPAELDGAQPTHFPAPSGEDSPGWERHEEGVFAVRVPAEWADGRDLIWTLRVHGETHVLRASIGSEPLQLDYGPRAMGSLPPLLRFASDGPAGQHPSGITLERTLEASVGTPLPLSVWVTDPSERSAEALGALYEDVPVRLTWFKHKGPVGGTVTFHRSGMPWTPAGREGEEAGEKVELENYQDRVGPTGGRSNVTATFERPGEYVLRVRADNWSAHDSTDGDQCCWTNGFVKVRVRP